MQVAIDVVLRDGEVQALRDLLTTLIDDKVEDFELSPIQTIIVCRILDRLQTITKETP